jgi:hypothetical protein
LHFHLFFQAFRQRACDNEGDFWNMESSLANALQNSNKATERTPDGAKDRWQFRLSRGRLESLTHKQGGTTFAGYGFGYDDANRLTSFTNSAYSTETRRMRMTIVDSSQVPTDRSNGMTKCTHTIQLEIEQVASTMRT